MSLAESKLRIMCIIDAIPFPPGKVRVMADMIAGVQRYAVIGWHLLVGDLVPMSELD